MSTKNIYLYYEGREVIIYLFILIFKCNLGLEPQITELPSPLIKAFGMQVGLVETYELKSWEMRIAEVIY
jgi:hypothetical protein